MKSYSKFTSEKTLTNYIVKMLNQDSNGDVLAYKRTGSGFSNETGKPDITGCCCGIRLEFEIKDPVRMNQDQEALIIDIEELWKGTGILGMDTLFKLNQEAFSELNSIASKIQQVWIKKFKKAGAYTGVVCSPTQVALACLEIRGG